MSIFGATGDRPLVYIAGGLTKADEQHLNVYKSIRDGCHQAGFESYLPHEDTGARSSVDLDPARVTEANLAAINRSVAVIADLAVPSHGVGIEIQYAHDRGKPVVGVAPARADVSRMLLGHPALDGRIYTYSRHRDVPSAVVRLIREQLRGIGTPRQRIISIEGIDFVGKSSLASALIRRLQGVGLGPVSLVSDPPWDLEPWSGLGDIFRTDERLSSVAEALLFGTARVDNYARVIKNTVDNGGLVVCDRYIDSWFAYQSVRLASAGMERALEFLLSMQTLWESFGTVVRPGLTILLTATEDELRKRSTETTREKKYEDLAFLNEVSEAYETLASRFPYRIARLETTGRTKEQIIEQATAIATEYLEPSTLDQEQ